MCPYRWIKIKKAIRTKMPIYFLKEMCHNCDKSRISELVTVDGTWIYKFEPQIYVNSKQWLCKYQLGLSV